MRIFGLILFLIVAIILFLDRKSTDLYSLDYEILVWKDLDFEIKSYYLNNISGVYNLDNGKPISISNTSMFPIKRGKKSFYYNKKKYYFKNNGNREVMPFLIKNNKLYILFDKSGGGPMFRTEETLLKYQFYCFKLP